MSSKVELSDNQLKIAMYKDGNCQQEAESIAIDDNSTKLDGESLFCQDGHVYQVYDASGKSSLFKSSSSMADCLKDNDTIVGVDGKDNEFSPDAPSTAGTTTTSVNAVLLGLVGTFVLHF